MNYKLASHDSITYLKPVKWYQRLFNFLAKCQSKTIEEQLEVGVEMFDLRVRFDEYGSVLFAHGLAEYEGPSVTEILTQINSLAKSSNELLYVRILLEEAYDDKTEWNEICFSDFCFNINNRYKHLQFCGGYRKWDWKQIYKFDIDNDTDISENDIDQNHSSFVSSKGKRTWCIWPWLYAKLNNKKILKKGTDKKYLMIDFI